MNPTANSRKVTGEYGDEFRSHFEVFILFSALHLSINVSTLLITIYNIYIQLKNTLQTG